MLNCELCDYYKPSSTYSRTDAKSIHCCEFTGFLFTEELDNYKIEYPCSSYGTADLAQMEIS